MVLTLTRYLVVSLTLCCFSMDLALAATNELAPPSLPTGCACPGDSLNYTCTVVGGSFTVWSGTALDCVGNQIVLLHSQFETGAAAGACGSLSATGDSVTEMCYNSTLTVPASVSLNGLTVGCDLEPEVTVSGSPQTLSVAGAAPTGLSVSSIHQSTFTLSWSPTVSCSSVTSYQVNVGGMSCGSCSYNPGANNATCSGWTINGQTCSFSVMSVICEGMTGEPSESVDVVLQEPGPPSVSTELKYQQSTSTLSSLSVSFPTVSPVQVAPGLIPLVTYSVQFNSDTREFPESNCSMGVCTGTFTDFPAEDFDLAVVVSNGLGNGRASPNMRVLSNISTAVSLTMEVQESTAIFTLNLLEGFVGTTDMRVEYRTGGGVVMNATNSSTASAGGSLSLTLTSLQVGAVYTFSLFITQNGSKIEMFGTFKSRCRQPEKLNNVTMCVGNFTGGVRTASGYICYTVTTPGGGFLAETFCDEWYRLEPESSGIRECLSDGTWDRSATSCVPISLPHTTCSAGCIVGIVCGVVLLISLIILLGCSIGVYQYKCKGCGYSEKHRLKSSSPPPPGPDSLNADPNTIEHQTTATGQEYAMVDVKGKKKKQTQEAALYQDPTTIKHQTAPSGAIYTEVDKPKRGSSKKREPDVVPPAGKEGLNYIEVEVTSGHQKPESDAQWQSEDPGCVEYSIVTPEADLQD